MSAVTPPAFPFRRACPYHPPTEYDAIREHGPLTRVSLPTGGDAWIVTRYDDVRRLLASPDLSSDARDERFPAMGVGEREAAAKARPFIRMDAPDHTRYRTAFLSEFSARRVRELEPAVTRVIDDALDRLPAVGPPVDFVRHVANAVSTGVICELVGVEDADTEFFRDVVRVSGSRHSTAEEVGRAIGSLFQLLDALVERRLAEPSTDLLGRFVQKHLVGGGFARQEVLSAIAMVVIAARETTTASIALATLQLLERPELVAAALVDPETLPGLVDELLRRTAVSDALPLRVATADIAVGEALIRAGDGVILLLGAANHDPERFPDPYAIDPSRPPRHLTFGHGAHACFGASLARMEIRLLLQALFTRYPDLRLATPLDQVELKHESASFGVEEMLVTW
ncbi:MULTISPECIES: cytochrome P450 [Clavibacter]|uniref:Cytochrome P450 n=2 Tax=Clavibacter TaxID=1573 RepID=A0A399NIY8_9MICO|nr:MULTISPECIES: cytochrome P450 [Clavibacter]KDP91448.1 cytochrome P450 [Clavibacter cf. michiganensis LMG 26808]RII93908.1 cytochrome P450 [Clavibacter michiganensis]UKF25383.1 cytochrome P450 [Clavibacter sp. A6099]